MSTRQAPNDPASHGAIPWALESVLNTLAAAAQPDGTAYRWGQHVRTQTGDNRRQFGLHGTAQAVIAFARLPDAHLHWHRFLIGGREWLEQRLAAPNKTSDSRKTLKLAELLTGLSAAGSQPAIREPLAARLAGAFDPKCRGWHFEVAPPSGSTCRPVATLYVLRALTASRVPNTSTNLDSSLQVAAKSALDAIAGAGNTRERHALACLFVFCLDSELHETGLFKDLRRDLPKLFGAVPARPSGLLDIYKVDYLFTGESGREDHAHCTLPFGLFDLWCQLWTGEQKLSLGEWTQTASAGAKDLVRLVQGRGGERLTLVEGLSVTAQILSRFPVSVEKPDEASSRVVPKASDAGDDLTQMWGLAKRHPIVAVTAIAAGLASAAGIGTYANNLLMTSELNEAKARLLQLESEQKIMQRSLNARLPKEEFLTLLAQFREAQVQNSPDGMRSASEALDKWLTIEEGKFKSTLSVHGAHPEGVEIVVGANPADSRLRFAHEQVTWPICWRKSATANPSKPLGTP